MTPTDPQFQRGDVIRIGDGPATTRYLITNIRNTDDGPGIELSLEAYQPPVCPDHWVPGAGDERIAVPEFGCPTCCGG